MSAAARSGRSRHPRDEPSIPNTPQARQHAEEARLLDAEMRRYGIHAERVAPTLNGQGHIRMDFEAMHLILDMLDHAYDGVPPDLPEQR